MRNKYNIIIFTLHWIKNSKHTLCTGLLPCKANCSVVVLVSLCLSALAKADGFLHIRQSPFSLSSRRFWAHWRWNVWPHSVVTLTSVVRNEDSHITHSSPVENADIFQSENLKTLLHLSVSCTPFRETETLHVDKKCLEYYWCKNFRHHVGNFFLVNEKERNRVYALKEKVRCC